jgi:hypothetical protein
VPQLSPESELRNPCHQVMGDHLVIPQLPKCNDPEWFCIFGAACEIGGCCSRESTWQSRLSMID